MGLDNIDYLRTARELIEKAAEQLREATNGPLVLSDDARQGLIADIRRMRLTVSLMTRDLRLLAGAANRRGQRGRDRQGHSSNSW